MKTRTKSAFVLLGTLVIGVILGVLLQTAIQNNRMERVRSLRDRGALPDVIIGVVNPRDAAQEIAIREIVMRYEEQHSTRIRGYWEARSELFDAMHQELVGSVLSTDQIEALDKWRERNRRSGRSGNQRGGGERDSDRDGDGDDSHREQSSERPN